MSSENTFIGHSTMGWILTPAVFLSVLNAALCFNIDPAAWRTLKNSAEGFGYQVVQRPSDLLVSAPLEQSSTRERGTIFRCSTTSTSSTCTKLSVPLSEFAVNTSLGLTMTDDPTTQNTMVCGPTIPRDCKSITLYKGVCVEINRYNRVKGQIPSTLEECKTPAIAFLLDGSGSVSTDDYEKMKIFVRRLIGTFVGEGIKFAIVQFSTSTIVHYDFNTFDTSKWESQINGIEQTFGWTYTAAAIKLVVQEVFSPEKGVKPNVKKILIVITDGQSNDRNELQEAAKLAEDKKIVRFAIGVGDVFVGKQAEQELHTIASSPSEKHVFKVETFDALEAVRKNLQDQIFSIEGSQKIGEALTMEMSQDGFSAAYVPGGIQMAIVGANQWMGGFKQYTSRGKQQNSYGPTDLEFLDSYLGYSMAVAKTTQGLFTLVGAPRYQHRGIVMAIRTNKRQRKIDPFPWQFQSGEYFGAEICTMDVDLDNFTDLILISAPMYMDTDREGRVYACSLTGLNVECHFESPSVLRGDASDRGRFGSSLAALPDLNLDGFSDMAIGAPLENNGQGSIYIFHGEERGRISLVSSQRIAGSEVMSGLKFFGISISQSSLDMSGDGLSDLAVGSKGSVVLLRSQPIVNVEFRVSFHPNQIPTQNVDCSKPLENTATICFTMKRFSKVDKARARINCTLTLDATRTSPNNRAYVGEKQQMETRSIDLDLTQEQCLHVNFFVQACPDDSLNALENLLRFSFDGLPSETQLRPSLALQTKTTSLHLLGYQINCGTDAKCVDNLKVDLNFTRSSEVRVGIHELLDVTVSVENREEDSYNSRVVLTYPLGFSFRTFEILRGRIECQSEDRALGLSQGKTDCTIDKPIFKSNATALFVVSYGIETNSQHDSRIFISADASSGNLNHSIFSELHSKKWIDVKYSIFITIESSLSYTNFSFGNNLQKPVNQSIVVTNDIRALNFTVWIRVPLQLGDEDIWVDSNSLMIPGCDREVDQRPPITDSVAQIQKNKLVDCSVAVCGVFKCNSFTERGERRLYTISANLRSGWIQQIGLQSAKFILTSTASLEYDKNLYIFYSEEHDNNPPARKIEAEVEVYTEPDFTTEIIGGSLGGLALLALITAGLYKAGFFKSKYKEMINEAGDKAEAGDEAEAGEPSLM